VAIADGRPVLRALKLFHASRARGLSVEMKVRLGPVTILGPLADADGRLKLLAAEGESIAGRRSASATRNSRIRFARGPGAFMDAWCAEGPRITSHSLSVTAQRHRPRRVAARPSSRSSREPSGVFAAIDLGRERSRGLRSAGRDRMELDESHRFEERPVRRGRLHWNLSRLRAALDGLRAAAATARCGASGSIPGASDYALLDAGGACSASVPLPRRANRRQ